MSEGTHTHEGVYRPGKVESGTDH